MKGSFGALENHAETVYGLYVKDNKVVKSK